MTMKRLVKILAVLHLVTLAAGARAAEVVVNGTPLAPELVAQIAAAYRTQIVPGRYWYDPVAGLWGIEGGPVAGQIQPGLALGGPLRPGASGGGTGVFINGRELHPSDVRGLQQLFGVVLPGRYWLNAMGVGGYEGGPPAFDLGAALGRRGGAGYNRTTPFGHLGSDGSCSYFMDPGSGASVMSGNC